MTVFHSVGRSTVEALQLDVAMAFLDSSGYGSCLPRSSTSVSRFRSTREDGEERRGSLSDKPAALEAHVLPAEPFTSSPGRGQGIARIDAATPLPHQVELPAHDVRALSTGADVSRDSSRHMTGKEARVRLLRGLRAFSLYRRAIEASRPEARSGGRTGRTPPKSASSSKLRARGVSRNALIKFRALGARFRPQCRTPAPDFGLSIPHVCKAPYKADPPPLQTHRQVHQACIAALAQEAAQDFAVRHESLRRYRAASGPRALVALRLVGLLRWNLVVSGESAPGVFERPILPMGVRTLSLLPSEREGGAVSLPAHLASPSGRAALEFIVPHPWRELHRHLQRRRRRCPGWDAGAFIAAGAGAFAEAARFERARGASRRGGEKFLFGTWARVAPRRSRKAPPPPSPSCRALGSPPAKGSAKGSRVAHRKCGAGGVRSFGRHMVPQARSSTTSATSGEKASTRVGPAWARSKDRLDHVRCHLDEPHVGHKVCHCPEP